MKKWMIVVIAVVLVAALVFIGFFGKIIVDIAKGADASSQTDASYEDVEAYAEKHWPNYICSYNADDRVLTLSQDTTMSYDNACSYGSSVYTDELAPETYLNQVRSIAIDVIAHCGDSSLNVVLEYVSNDGKPIFSVGSDGNIWTCWE